MPYFVVKVTLKDGWLRPPIVANFPDETSAVDAVRTMVDETDNIEIKGQRTDVMIAAFGEMPEGTAVMRADWVWKGENSDTPEPY